MAQPLLEGEYSEVPQPQVCDLKERIKVLEFQLDEMRRSVPREAVVLLLNVLGQAMRDVANGKYRADVEVPTNNGKWEAIKSRLSPRLRECVDLLLIQKRMKRTQIAAAMKMGYTNCANNVISKLVAQGILEENNGDMVLKEF